jgi:hypothetical protein
MESVRERDIGRPLVYSYNQSNWGLVDYDPKLAANVAARSQWLGGLEGA